jgi:Leucine rich repeat
LIAPDHKLSLTSAHFYRPVPDRQENQDDGTPPGIPVDGGDADPPPPTVRDDSLVEGLCSLNADEYRDSILSLVVYEMKAAGFDTSYWTERSYPAQALDWIANQDPLVICPTPASTERLVQRFLLGLLYLQLSGPSWNEQSGWMTGTSECDWYGVECDDASDHVIRVSLKRNGLQGRLPPQILAIPQLQTLSLDHNAIGGTLPPSLGGATNLHVLELDDNQLNGTIPSELYGLVQLQALDLNTNRISGTLSRQIENLSNLVVLQLERNQLTGLLPTTSLQRLNDLGTSIGCNGYLYAKDERS